MMLAMVELSGSFNGCNDRDFQAIIKVQDEVDFVASGEALVGLKQHEVEPARLECYLCMGGNNNIGAFAHFGNALLFIRLMHFNPSELFARRP